MLTDTKIRALKPDQKPYRVADSNGLCRKVTPAGSKLWRYRFRFAGFGPHGVRGKFSAWAHDSGFDSAIIEAQLAHRDRNTTRASYNRSAFMAQRQVMMAQWSALLTANPDNVVPIRSPCG
jgi:integrase